MFNGDFLKFFLCDVKFSIGQANDIAEVVVDDCDSLHGVPGKHGWVEAGKKVFKLG